MKIIAPAYFILTAGFCAWAYTITSVLQDGRISGGFAACTVIAGIGAIVSARQ